MSLLATLDAQGYRVIFWILKHPVTLLVWLLILILLFWAFGWLKGRLTRVP